MPRALPRSVGVRSKTDEGDPWAASSEEEVAHGASDAEAELREVMGDYWLDAETMRALLDSK